MVGWGGGGSSIEARPFTPKSKGEKGLVSCNRPLLHSQQDSSEIAQFPVTCQNKGKII